MLSDFSSLIKLREFGNALARKHRGLASFLGVFLGLSAVFGLSSCSPGMFSGSNQDDGVVKLRDYRRINLACSGLNVANAHISVADYRKVLHCFNSYGGLQPIEDLVNRMSDDDLKPIVDAGNHYIIDNPKLLYQLEQTFFSLSNLKILDSTFANFGKLLENEEFVSSGLAVLREGYTAGWASGGIAGDRSILLALQQFSTRLTPDNAASLIDVGLTLARARAFTELQTFFRGEGPTRRPLRELTDQVLEYFQKEGNPDQVQAGLGLFKEAANGDLFQALDALIGSDPSRFGLTVPRISAVMEATFGSGAKTMDGLTSLLHYAHQPIHCLKGGLTVPDPVMHVLDELSKRQSSEAATYLRRTSKLILSAVAPVCDHADEIAAYYPAMDEVAGTTAMGPMADLIQAAYGVRAVDTSGTITHPLAELLVDFFADTGNGGKSIFPGDTPENSVGVKLLLPAFAELTDRGVWNDVLLLASMPRMEDRPPLEGTFRFLTEPMPGSDDSIYSAYTNAIARATPQDVYNLVHSFERFVDSDQKLLDPSLTSLRQALYVNDVHPLIDLARSILSEAPANDPLFNTMFLISELPQFQGSVKLVSDMAKDGRLKELLGSILTIFHKFAVQGATPVLAAKEPPFVPFARENLAGSDLTNFGISKEPPLGDGSCGKLDARVSLGNYEDPQFDAQLGAVTACYDSDHEHGDFGEAVGFLKGHRDERHKDYVASTIDLFWAMNMTHDELAYLGESFISAFDGLQLKQSLSAIKMLVLSSVHGTSDGVGAAGPVLRPLMDLMAPIVDASVRPGLDDLQRFAAGVVRRADFPRLLRYTDELLNAQDEPVAAQTQNSYDWARIKRWVGNKECQKFPLHATSTELDALETKRASQLTDDYEHAITTWDLTADGEPRRDWELSELKGLIDGVLTKFGDPAQSVRPGAAIDSLLGSLRYFSLPDNETKLNAYQHYHAEDLRKFLIDRSNDYQLITYFYPGESAPRVRLVSTMDRLELVLVNADFWAPWPFVPGHTIPNFKNHRNFGLLFLAQIADAWGDEDESVWPEEIRKKFVNTRPPTLAQAVASMSAQAREFEKLAGLPALPGCDQAADPNDPPALQQSETHDPHMRGTAPSWMPAFHIPLMQKYLFNIHQILPVLVENLPAPGQPLGQGGKMVNGMRILRDLFYQLYYSTPEAYRMADFENPRDGFKNNLSIIMRLERAGFTRQITRNLRGTKVDDPSAVDFFNAMIAGATASPDPLGTTAHPTYLAHALIDPLVDPKSEADPSKPQHLLFWKVVQSIFGIIDAAEGRTLDASHQAELDGQPADEVAKIREGWAQEFALMKQLGYYSFAAASPLNLIGPAIKAIGPVLSQYNSFLSQNGDKVESIFRSRKAAGFMRALYEDKTQVEEKTALAAVLTQLLEQPQHGLEAVGLLQSIGQSPLAKQSAPLFSDRWTALAATSDYQNLKVDQVTHQIFDFFEQKGSDIRGQEAARRIEDFLAERLEAGDLDQYLLLAATDPNGFYQVLQTLGHSIDDGDLIELFQEVRDALPTPSIAGK